MQVGKSQGIIFYCNFKIENRKYLPTDNYDTELRQPAVLRKECDLAISLLSEKGELVDNKHNRISWDAA